MSRKIDLTEHQGKDRIYISVKGTTGISRLHAWTGIRYLPPEENSFLARRWEKGKRLSKYHTSLTDARTWQRTGDDVSPGECASEVTESSAGSKPVGKKFRALIVHWRNRYHSSLEESTVEHYEKLIRLHFGFFMDMPVPAITPGAVDEWLDVLIANKDRYKLNFRTSFRHEVALLSTLLNIYISDFNDPNFLMPINKRHRARSRLKCVNRQVRLLDLKEEEFQRFKEALSTERSGRVLAALATVQFYQALRIQEAVALNGNSVVLDEDSKTFQMLHVHQRAIYLRVKTKPPFIKQGLKNAPFKPLRVLPEVHEVLKEFYRPGMTNELIFPDPETGKLFAYSFIENAFNRAFKRAGLPYSATHVMRHGGGRLVYNGTNSDLEITKQALGNSTLQSVLVYAKRDPKAHTEYVEKKWAEVGGRKWSQDGEK